jgi:hypothetical protein
VPEKTLLCFLTLLFVVVAIVLFVLFSSLCFSHFLPFCSSAFVFVSVLLIYDPQSTKNGKLSLKAYRLTDFFMKNYQQQQPFSLRGYVCSPLAFIGLSFTAAYFAVAFCPLFAGPRWTR